MVLLSTVIIIMVYAFHFHVHLLSIYISYGMLEHNIINLMTCNYIELVCGIERIQLYPQINFIVDEIIYII